MALKLYNETDIEAIADAIRGKNGSSDTYTVSQMAQAIDDIPAAGGDDIVLPSGYTKLMYIESSGTQYIDLGLNTKNGDSIEFAISDDCAGNVFGNNVSGCASFLQVQNGNGYWQFGSESYHSFSQIYFRNLGAQMMKMDIDAMSIYSSLQNDWIAFIQNSNSTVTENTEIHNILFGRTTGANTRQLSSSAKFYRFKYYSSGVLIRDMYPCIRNSDDAIGMYDMANNTFYGNDGTGSFTGGAYD